MEALRDRIGRVQQESHVAYLEQKVQELEKTVKVQQQKLEELGTRVTYLENKQS